VFDFRYHAFSLVAVFLALAIGLLLGVAIGDKELVSSAERDLRSSLRGDMRQTRQESDDLRRQLEDRRRFEGDVYPLMVSGRLTGMRVGIVALGGLGNELMKSVRGALEPAGARLVAVTVVHEPPDLKKLAEKATGTRYEQLAATVEPALIEQFGVRIGEQIVVGGRLIDRIRRVLFTSASGEIGALDAVVVFRAEQNRGGEVAKQRAQFDRGLIAGLTRASKVAVGVEQTSTDPSQVEWYEEQSLASVDNIEDIAGQLALVLALGGAEGNYGRKSTADALLPRAVPQVAEQ
jgi:hypothetical protein